MFTAMSTVMQSARIFISRLTTKFLKPSLFTRTNFTRTKDTFPLLFQISTMLKSILTMRKKGFLFL